MPTTINHHELLTALAAADPPVLIEALGADYFTDAHLPGAINIPVAQVDQLAPRYLLDADADLVVYCTGACDSSRLAARRLEALGYRNVRVYEGGKEEWVELGLPIERGAGGTDRT